MLIKILPSLLSAIGEILIGYSLLMVHAKMSKEKKIDELVVNEMKEEKLYVIIGIILIASGFLLNLIFNV